MSAILNVAFVGLLIPATGFTIHNKSVVHLVFSENWLNALVVHQQFHHFLLYLLLMSVLLIFEMQLINGALLLKATF